MADRSAPYFSPSDQPEGGSSGPSAGGLPRRLRDDPCGHAALWPYCQCAGSPTPIPPAFGIGSASAPASHPFCARRALSAWTACWCAAMWASAVFRCPLLFQQPRFPFPLVFRRLPSSTRSFLFPPPSPALRSEAAWPQASFCILPTCGCKTRKALSQDHSLDRRHLSASLLQAEDFPPLQPADFAPDPCPRTGQATEQMRHVLI